MNARDKCRKKRNALVRRYKEMKGCNDCGGKFPHFVLQLDHRNPSTKTRNGGVDGRQCVWRDLSKPALKEELGKCDVVCANCHAIRTYDRNQQRMQG